MKTLKPLPLRHCNGEACQRNADRRGRPIGRYEGVRRTALCGPSVGSVVAIGGFQRPTSWLVREMLFLSGVWVLLRRRAIFSADDAARWRLTGFLA